MRGERGRGGEEGREEREGSGEEMKGKGEKGSGEDGICTLSQPVTRQERLTDVEVHLQMENMEPEQQYAVRVDEKKMATVIDLGHNGQDSSCA